MNNTVLTDNEMKTSTFNRLRQLIHDCSGISLSSNKEALVKSRLAKRMRRLGIGRYEDYLDLVTNDATGAELEQLLDVISTNVTSFYREADHFKVMRDVVMDRVASGASQLRVWSAACSTGEEPYTMAIEILEALGAKKSIDVKVLATDIAPSVLQTCLRGDYSAEKVKSVPTHLRDKYFTKQNNHGVMVHTVKDVVRKKVLFRQFNLNTFPYPLRGPLDFIFCRNVMIYFDRAMRIRIVSEFSRLLRSGGYLFLGHSESLNGMSEGYSVVKPSVYTKV